MLLDLLLDLLNYTFLIHCLYTQIYILLLFNTKYIINTQKAFVYENIRNIYEIYIFLLFDIQNIQIIHKIQNIQIIHEKQNIAKNIITHYKSQKSPLNSGIYDNDIFRLHLQNKTALICHVARYADFVVKIFIPDWSSAL